MSKYAYGVLSICILDLWATIAGIERGMITEGNPYLLEAYERGGVATMAAVKIAMTATAVAILEGARETGRSACLAVESGYKLLIGAQIVILAPLHVAHLFFL